MSVKFRCISADPPWAFDDELKKMRDGTRRGASSQYPILNIDEIAKLRVSELAAPDGCVLFLWCPSVLIPDGLRTMAAWGFDYKQTYIWIKTKKGKATLVESAVEGEADDINPNEELAFGMGRLFRAVHEIALVGTRGKDVYKHLKNKSQRSACFAENLGHSKKPEAPQDSLELMFPDGPFLELFARRKRTNWTCIGNEVCDGEDIRDSIKRLLGEQE